MACVVGSTDGERVQRPIIFNHISQTLIESDYNSSKPNLCETVII